MLVLAFTYSKVTEVQGPGGAHAMPSIDRGRDFQLVNQPVNGGARNFQESRRLQLIVPASAESPHDQAALEIAHLVVERCAFGLIRPSRKLVRKMLHAHLRTVTNDDRAFDY